MKYPHSRFGQRSLQFESASAEPQFGQMRSGPCGSWEAFLP